MSKSRILYLFTRTPLHVGAGSSVGAIDQPIVRERHTGFPVIPGTSLKGVLRDTARRDEQLRPDVDRIFGKQDDAGRLSLGEAKLLAFPVRSAKGSFAFATCPLALERFVREHGGPGPLQGPLEPEHIQCLRGPAATLSRHSHTGDVPGAI